jgi:hypothetical protein
LTVSFQAQPQYVVGTHSKPGSAIFYFIISAFRN